jgi:predicted nucleotidyltransferase
MDSGKDGNAPPPGVAERRVVTQNAVQDNRRIRANHQAQPPPGSRRPDGCPASGDPAQRGRPSCGPLGHPGAGALFGSALQDDFTPASDIDGLVPGAPDSPGRSLLDLLGVKQDLAALLRRRVDWGEANTLDPFIRGAILATRRVIYVAPPH